MSDRPSPFRRWLRRYSLTLMAALGGAAGVAYAATRPEPAAPPRAAAPARIATGPASPARDAVEDRVQIAILLDTSSSMNGLINQARSNLWNMVDEMGKMTRVVDGRVRGVRVELALYEYGNSRLPATGGHIRQVLPLTTDLDRVSEELHGLSTTGGDEYAGQAILEAVKSLEWSADPAALRFVFVAGNEGFDQGPVSATDAMAAARARDIHVQLIQCGMYEQGWLEAAALAGTDLMKIDQNHVAQHIPSPQDSEILRLGQQLNSTYLAYGAEGAAAQRRQVSADAASAKLSPKVALERSSLKSKSSYRNERWDLVDAVSKDGDFLDKTDDEKLPAELRGKSLEEKQRIVSAMAAERAAIKARLGKLQAERAAFLAAQQASAPAAQSLDTEMLRSARKKAESKGYKY